MDLMVLRKYLDDGHLLRRRVLRWFFPAVFVAAIGISSACVAQPAYPPEALKNATSTTAAANALGAVKPELSGYLLIDAPDVALPGKVQVSVESQLPGTSQIVLLRTSRRAVGTAPAAPEKVLIAAAEIGPGKKAAINADVDLNTTTDLILLAQFRGQWFYAQRQVKIGSPAD